MSLIKEQTALACSSALSQISNLKKNLGTVIRGKPDAIDQLIVALIAGESILIEDVPGVGKTTLAKSLAAFLDLDFKRIQCTPDLLPADVLGTSIFNPKQGTFQFRKGPVFCNVLLVDEINRASPRTQSALLEAMAEKQVTIEGESYQLDRPFMVIATQNPLGFHGTFPLPESQLDRFLMQISMEYPDRESELAILYGEPTEDPVKPLQPSCSLDDLLAVQHKVAGVRFERSVAEYLMTIVEATRNDARIQLGCSPRGTIKLFTAAKALAMVLGRDFVIPDDVQKMAPLVLRHRLVLNRTNHGGSSKAAGQLIEDLIGQIHVPI